MTPAEVLASLTPAQRHGLAFWDSILDALVPRAVVPSKTGEVLPIRPAIGVP